MIKTSAICIALVVLVLGALPFGANAAQSTQSTDGMVVVTVNTATDSAKSDQPLSFTTIHNNGDMSGVDKNGHSWTFESNATRYHNQGTGKTCFGAVARHHCLTASRQVLTIR